MNILNSFKAQKKIFLPWNCIIAAFFLPRALITSVITVTFNAVCQQRCCGVTHHLTQKASNECKGFYCTAVVVLGEAAGAELGRCNEADGSNRLNASIAIFLDRGPLPDDCLWLTWSDKPPPLTLSRVSNWTITYSNPPPHPPTPIPQFLIMFCCCCFSVSPDPYTTANTPSYRCQNNWHIDCGPLNERRKKTCSDQYYSVSLQWKFNFWCVLGDC